MRRTTMTQEEIKAFEQALNTAWKGYVDRGAATVDALEDNTQELAFAKGFKAGCEQGYKNAIGKACEWLEKNACNYEYSGGTCDSWFSASDLVESFRKYMEEQL